MSNLLRCAYVERPCHACGGSFRVTLHEMLMEHRVNREWESTRKCSVCSLENRQLMWVVPPELLENLERAWQDTLEAAEKAGVELQTTE